MQLSLIIMTVIFVDVILILLTEFVELFALWMENEETMV